MVLGLVGSGVARERTEGSFAAAEGGEQQRRIRELKTQAAPLLEELKTLGCTEEDLLQLWRGGETHA